MSERKKLGMRMGLAVVGVLTGLAVSAGSASADLLPVSSTCTSVKSTTTVTTMKTSTCFGDNSSLKGVRWQ